MRLDLKTTKLRFEDNNINCPIKHIIEKKKHKMAFMKLPLNVLLFWTVGYESK